MGRAARLKRNRELTSIGALMARFAPKTAPPPDLPPDVVDEITWRRLVGVGIAKRTRPVSLSRGVLLVQVGSSAWAQQLSMLTDTIRERLADMGLVVRSLRFRVGPVEPLRREPARVVRVRDVPKAPLPDELRRTLAEVPDTELRAVIAAAAASNLAWQEGLATARRRVVPSLPPVAAESAPPVRTLPPVPGAPRGKRGAR